MAKNIVIIGGGFAGINLTLQLSGNQAYQLTLVDKNNYNFFPPLIYQVATAFLEPSSISYPFRKLLRKRKNVHFRLASVLRVRPEENKIVLSNGELDYDYLVFATGAETNYFGMENVKKNAIPMKTLSDALEMRNTLLQRIEQATITQDPVERKKLTTIVVAGGGPTGVEVSGMFAEMRSNIVLKDYPELNGAGGRIYLVDGGANLLAPMSAQSQKDTFHALEKLGVHIKLGVQVKDFANDEVLLSTGEVIHAKTLIWAAGVSAMVCEGMPAGSYGRGKRLLVDEFHKVKDTSNIYAIGDTCIQSGDPNFPNGHPQVAQVAIQQGKHLGKYFRNLVNEKSIAAFVYKDKGSLAIIGSSKAVADLPPKLHFRGFIAWFIWLFVHLMSLINYRNRLKTFYNWMVAYFSRDQSLRMIIRPSQEKKSPE